MSQFYCCLHCLCYVSQYGTIRDAENKDCRVWTANRNACLECCVHVNKNLSCNDEGSVHCLHVQIDNKCQTLSPKPWCTRTWHRLLKLLSVCLTFNRPCNVHLILRFSKHVATWKPCCTSFLFITSHSSVMDFLLGVPWTQSCLEYNILSAFHC